MGLLKKRKVFNEMDTDLNSRMNILLCSDKNVIRGLGVTIVSILENVSADCAVHIAFNGDLPKIEEKRFQTLALKYNIPIYFYWINDQDIQSFHSNTYITQTAYYRLLLPYVLNKFEIKRCLYLDTDMICVNDISSWYHQDLSDYIAYVTKDATSELHLREEKTCAEIGMQGTKYFNSGMMLINIPEYVRYDAGYKAMKLCMKTNFGAMDQDVLNIVLEGHVHFDDSYAYNCAMSVLNTELPETIYIVHFTGAKKPWRACVSNLNEHTCSFGDKRSWRYKYYRIWREYASRSFWKDEPFDAPKNHTEWRYFSMVSLKNGQLVKALKLYCKYIACKMHV